MLSTQSRLQCHSIYSKRAQSSEKVRSTAHAVKLHNRPTVVFNKDHQAIVQHACSISTQHAHSIRGQHACITSRRHAVLGGLKDNMQTVDKTGKSNPVESACNVRTLTLQAYAAGVTMVDSEP